ncbi:hypothetical protein AB0903_17015 [Streptomyces sp. NPDC048389]
MISVHRLPGVHDPHEVADYVKCARAWTFRVGYGLVAVYALKVALPLP